MANKIYKSSKQLQSPESPKQVEPLKDNYLIPLTKLQEVAQECRYGAILVGMLVPELREHEILDEMVGLPDPARCLSVNNLYEDIHVFVGKTELDVFLEPRSGGPYTDKGFYLHPGDAGGSWKIIKDPQASHVLVYVLNKEP